MTRFRKLRRAVALAVVLAVTALVVPDSSVAPATVALMKVTTAEGVGHGPDVLWILALGSDARPGQNVLRSRADAIQLVGVNLKTGAGTAIGIPRDSYVTIPGHGREKINASMYFGGPQLMAASVANLVGIRPDYVVVTSFKGLIHMIWTIGGITVNSPIAFGEAELHGHFRKGKQHINGVEALAFARIRHPLLRGDFDRSANQQRELVGILRQVRANRERRGFMERAVMAVARSMDTNLRPAELFTLAESLTQVQPAKFRRCVIQGGIGFAGAASVVFPNYAQARSIAARVRNDATLNGRC